MVGGFICFSLQHNDTKKHVHAMHVFISCFNKRAANNGNLRYFPLSYGVDTRYCRCRLTQDLTRYNRHVAEGFGLFAKVFRYTVSFDMCILLEYVIVNVIIIRMYFKYFDQVIIAQV